MSPTNYYRIELWPGSYTFTVYLPEETFLGQTSRELSTSKRIVLEPGDAGHTFVFQYTDGMTAEGFSLAPLTTDTNITDGRTLAGTIGLRDTAKVLELYGARYDGPSRQGKAYGWGTLTWPDGSVYQGVFEYGEPTPQGQFFFPQGGYFRGNLLEGRPYRSGLLFARDGTIVFSGRFIDEKPHGRGIRTGSEGPQFCVYDHGQDITKSVEQLAEEALDQVEVKQVEDLLAPVTLIENQLSEEKEKLARLQKHYLQAMDGEKALDKRLKALKESIANLKQQRNAGLEKARLQQQALIADFPRTRYARELAMRKRITAQLDQAVARERDWCLSEIAQDRRWCQCAPFADDYLEWTDCQPK